MRSFTFTPPKSFLEGNEGPKKRAADDGCCSNEQGRAALERLSTTVVVAGNLCACSRGSNGVHRAELGGCDTGSRGSEGDSFPTHTGDNGEGLSTEG